MAAEALATRFGDALQRGIPLAKYTAARIGGPADYLLVARSRADLIDSARMAWAAGLPLLILGGGANVLIDDAGFRGLVVINKADMIRIDGTSAFAESGASLSTLARRCIKQGLAGLAWCVSVPGTVGGAVINNAGAHGGDMAQCVQSVGVLLRGGAVESWPAARMGYAYRASALKGRRDYVLLGVTLALDKADSDVLRDRARGFTEHRKATQPPGASLGSIFKNPPGDYAGRLIDAAGLKGARVGSVMISPVHANFFVNQGEASAADYRALIDLAQARVYAHFGVRLALEIEVIGAQPA